jgi:hypothetical protein
MAGMIVTPGPEGQLGQRTAARHLSKVTAAAFTLAE